VFASSKPPLITSCWGSGVGVEEGDSISVEAEIELDGNSEDESVADGDSSTGVDVDTVEMTVVEENVLRTSDDRAIELDCVELSEDTAVEEVELTGRKAEARVDDGITLLAGETESDRDTGPDDWLRDAEIVEDDTAEDDATEDDSTEDDATEVETAADDETVEDETTEEEIAADEETADEETIDADADADEDATEDEATELLTTAEKEAAVVDNEAVTLLEEIRADGDAAVLDDEKTWNDDEDCEVKPEETMFGDDVGESAVDDVLTVINVELLDCVAELDRALEDDADWQRP
jgi:hypothetical protein